MCLSGWLPMAYKIKHKKHPVSGVSFMLSPQIAQLTWIAVPP